MIIPRGNALRIVLFGATGRTGHLLLQRALRLGHNVSAYVRDPARLEVKHDRLHVVRGDVLDPLSVHWAVAGADAVLSALGFSARRPPPILSDGVRHILDGMETHRVRRIVILSAAGALHEGARCFVGTVGLGLARLFLSGFYSEHRKMLETLQRRERDLAPGRPVPPSGGLA